jgi:adenine-specific DNA glycosylase
MAPKKTTERAAAILKIINSRYPQVQPQLFYRNPFELLVATILSAQCTDNQVNRVTPVLFKHMRTPQDFAKTPVTEIEGLVRPTGFYRNKARNIKGCCEALIERHGGRVPRTLEELVALPGVGPHIRPARADEAQGSEENRARPHATHSTAGVERLLAAYHLFRPRDLHGQKTQVPHLPSRPSLSLPP